MTLTSYEAVAVATAMDKALKGVAKTARAEADSDLMEAYEGMGFEKMALKLSGQKVGEFAVVFAKDGWEVADKDAFEDFALTYGFAKVRRSIRPDMVDSVVSALRDAGYTEEILEEIVNEEVTVDSDWERYVTSVGGVPTFLDSGEIVPGLEFRPKHPKGTRVTGCKPEEVLPLVAQLPGGVEALLLGGEVA